MFRNFLLLIFLTSQMAFCRTIDVIGDFKVNHIPIDWSLFQNYGVQVRGFFTPFSNYLENYYSDEVEKVIFMNEVGVRVPDLVAKIPKEKLILFNWEPRKIPDEFCFLFKEVYTYNDILIDNKLYKKFYYPHLRPMIKNKVPFEEKKLCTLIAGNWTRQRIKVVNFFDNKPIDDFDYWGGFPIPYGNNKRYRGKIPGLHSGIEHIDTLNKYKFCICFENSKIPGYITEKIFNCFTARCIPVYWGAPNLQRYIPRNCFIDYDSFSTLEELYQFLKNMPEEVYQEYIEAINEFLCSEEGEVFLPKYLEDLLRKIIHQ